jgi:hypothetical protein
MSRLDYYLTDNSAQEAADFAHETDLAKLLDSVRDLSGGALGRFANETIGEDKLADLVVDRIVSAAWDAEQIAEIAKRVGVRL